MPVRVFGGGFINWSGIFSKISKDLHCDVLYIVPAHCVSFQSFFLLKQGLHDILDVFYKWKWHQHHDRAQIGGAPSPWTPSGLQMKLFWSLLLEPRQKFPVQWMFLSNIQSKASYCLEIRSKNSMLTTCNRNKRMTGSAFQLKFLTFNLFLYKQSWRLTKIHKRTKVEMWEEDKTKPSYIFIYIYIRYTQTLDR